MNGICLITSFPPKPVQTYIPQTVKLPSCPHGLSFHVHNLINNLGGILDEKYECCTFSFGGNLAGARLAQVERNVEQTSEVWAENM